MRGWRAAKHNPRHRSQKEQGNMKSWKSILVSAVAFLLVLAPASLAWADSGGVQGHSFDSTFTKWVVSPGAPPVIFNMVGVVGGDVGEGTFAGEVLSDVTNGNIETIMPLYHFYGSKHSFTALLTVTLDNSIGQATITGQVTEGWLQGFAVTGEFTTNAVCPIATPGNIVGTVCWRGALHVHAGPE
jgi:hypothetical protein